MKFFLNKIIFSICIVISINACHTFEHQNIFNQDFNKRPNEKLLDKENINLKLTVKKSTENKEMVPIDLPKATETVQKVALQKKVKKPNTDKFNLDKFINWNEEKIIKTLGSSHFIKEEGRLKNYQYHFKECFIDIFLLKKNELYLVNYVEMRPTKLNGTVNIEACLKEINQIVN
tara:strand:- start:52 stop:576 length:525 start_codon:yes stop_codon:yes gene_type:complete